jgi:hypothetical protein
MHRKKILSKKPPFLGVRTCQKCDVLLVGVTKNWSKNGQKWVFLKFGGSKNLKKNGFRYVKRGPKYPKMPKIDQRIILPYQKFLGFFDFFEKIGKNAKNDHFFD